MAARRLVLALSTLASFAAPASAADLGAYRPAEVIARPAVEDPCGKPAVLSYITRNFAWAERHTWRRGFTIAALENPRFRYIDADPTTIPKRRCEADVAMTNGWRSTVYYEIQDGQGFASIGDRVLYCVVGLDPWHIYNEACRVVR